MFRTFSRAEVQKSSRQFSHGLDFSLMNFLGALFSPKKAKRPNEFHKKHNDKAKLL